MARYLGVECPNCVRLFAIAQLEGSVTTQHQDLMVLHNVDCPHCGHHFPELAAEISEFEAEEAPMSLKS